MSSRKRPLPNAEPPVSSATLPIDDGPLSGFDLRGYRPSPDRSDDVNYMDVVMILTRSQTLKQGSMGCILVKPVDDEATTSKEDAKDVQNDGRGDYADRFFGRIIAAATNTSLFKKDESDVHAEINAIGQVAKRSMPSPDAISTRGATAYITMPPCKNCFGALNASGVKRIVSRTSFLPMLTNAASKVGIEMASLTKDEMLEQKERMNEIFANSAVKGDGGGSDEMKNAEGNMDEVWRRREARKEEKKARKLAKIARIEAESGSER